MGPALIGAVLIATFAGEVRRAGAESDAGWLAAQIEVESAWRPEARSEYAAGLAQFTPPTWGDVAPRTRPSCASAEPTDPACSIRAQIHYMAALQRSLAAARTPRLHALSAYNGGLGWVRREMRECAKRRRCDPYDWDDLRLVCVRSKWACAENKAYPDKVMERVRSYAWIADRVRRPYGRE